MPAYDASSLAATLGNAEDVLWVILSIGVAVALLFTVRALLDAAKPSPTKDLRTHAVMSGLTLFTILGLGLILARVFGLDAEQSATIVKIIGGLIVGILGLSATTILGNALAGL